MKFKIAVSSPEMSERIQKFLFERGYAWQGDAIQEIQFTDKYGLFLDEKGISFSNKDYFDREPEYPEYVAVDLGIALLPVEDYIKVEGKFYKRSDYNKAMKEALKSLEPVGGGVL